MDLIGHDVNYKVTSTVHEAFFGTPDTDPATPNASLSLRTGWGEKRDGILHLRRIKEAAPSGVAVEGVSERILAMLMNEAADAVFGKSDPRRPLIWPCKKASITPKVSWLGPMNGAFRKSSTCWNLCGNDTAKSDTGCPVVARHGSDQTDVLQLRARVHRRMPAT